MKCILFSWVASRKYILYIGNSRVQHRDRIHREKSRAHPAVFHTSPPRILDRFHTCFTPLQCTLGTSGKIRRVVVLQVNHINRIGSSSRQAYRFLSIYPFSRVGSKVIEDINNVSGILRILIYLFICFILFKYSII
jgi:hypothetical protein